MKHFRKWFVIQKCVLTLVPYPQVVQTLILRFFSPNVDIVIRRPYKDFYPEATILLFWVREEHRNHLQICEITKKELQILQKNTKDIINYYNQLKNLNKTVLKCQWERKIP